VINITYEEQNATPSPKLDDMTADDARGEVTCDCSTVQLVSTLPVRHSENNSCITLSKIVSLAFHEMRRSTAMLT
jgi:hypothetical protein